MRTFGACGGRGGGGLLSRHINCYPLDLRERLGGNKSKQKWMTVDFINSKKTIRKSKTEHKKGGKNTQNQKYSSKGKHFSANNREPKHDAFLSTRTPSSRGETGSRLDLLALSMSRQ